MSKENNLSTTGLIRIKPICESEPFIGFDNRPKMRIFNTEDVGGILQKLFESGISYDIESHAGNIVYDIGTAQSGFIGVLDDRESDSISYTVSRMAREVSEEYPESDFAKWYNSL